MTQTITQAFVQQFDNAIRMQAQQKEARLVSTVTDRGNITGESFTANRLAPTEDTPEDNVRHGDTVFSEIEHSTRIAVMRDYFQALPIDRADEPKVLASPLQGSYSQSLISAYNRRKDSVVFKALLDPSQTKEGAFISLPAAQIITASATGFTKAKLITTRKLFRKNEADQHNGETLNIAYTSDMLEDVLSDTTLTSADFMAVKMLQEGDLSSKWMGFNWIPYERVRLSGSEATTAAWAGSAVHFGTGFFEADAKRRADKKNLMQVSVAASNGAVRVWEYGVVQIGFTV